jgi:hypothetical protein
MGAFKQFLSTDVTVVPFVVNKSFYFEGSASLEEVSIKKYYGKNIPYSSSSDLGYYNSQSISANLVYNSIKQLYYTNYIPTPSQSQSPLPVYNNNGVLLSNYSSSATNARFYNYEQTTLFQTGSGSYSSQYGYSRYFPTESNSNISILSIPKNIFGDYINPNTFYLKYSSANDSGDVEINDNGEGILQFQNNSSPYYGIITYQHGLISFDQSWDDESPEWIQGTDITCSFQSSRTIYETQYKCTIRPDEFNYSLNPSLLSGSLISGSTDGTPYDFATGSYFSPYVTTIGLYNENQELLAVAKLGQPLPTSRTTDTTIIINLDR